MTDGNSTTGMVMQFVKTEEDFILSFKGKIYHISSDVSLPEVTRFICKRISHIIGGNSVKFDTNMGYKPIAYASGIDVDAMKQTIEELCSDMFLVKKIEDFIECA
jgi:hypothetical protein